MTKSKSNAVTDFVLPIGVLLAICVVMSFLLALTNQATAPVIEASELAAAESARKEVMPQADGFELVTDTPSVSEDQSVTVTEVYKATNDAGYVFMITAKGYGGKNTLSMVCGIDMDGAITETTVLSHSETVGLGAKITTSEFKGQFPGKDASYVSSIDNIDTISGATRSSNFYRAALAYTFTVYESVKGAA